MELGEVDIVRDSMLSSLLLFAFRTFPVLLCIVLTVINIVVRIIVVTFPCSRLDLVSRETLCNTIHLVFDDDHSTLHFVHTILGQLGFVNGILHSILKATQLFHQSL